MKTQLTSFSRDDRAILIVLALANFLVHMLTNNQYGFHRDELDILDNARYPAWGYVAYPPFTRSSRHFRMPKLANAVGLVLAKHSAFWIKT